MDMAAAMNAGEMEIVDAGKKVIDISVMSTQEFKRNFRKITSVHPIDKRDRMLYFYLSERESFLANRKRTRSTRRISKQAFLWRKIRFPLATLSKSALRKLSKKRCKENFPGEEPMVRDGLIHVQGDEDNDNVERVMLWNQQVRKERLLNKYKDFVNMAYQLVHCTPKFSKKAERLHIAIHMHEQYLIPAAKQEVDSISDQLNTVMDRLDSLNRWTLY